jgi:uncharacterized caspase-like protein
VNNDSPQRCAHPGRRVALARLSALSLTPFLPSVAGATDAAIHALPRIALVIGNCAYTDAPLLNPINDAKAIAHELKQFGFAVELHTDNSRQSMQAAIAAYCERLARQRSVGLFYFAGHALQVDWRNFLVPVDARLATAEDVRRHTVDLTTLFSGLTKAGNPMNIVVLDACRDNPFSAERRTGKGLSQMDAPTGTLLAYATAPGNVAADGSGKHGLYTENLLREMTAPEARIEDVFKRVRLAVRRRSNGQQIPWESTSLEDDFYFRPPAILKQRSEEELARAFEEEASLWRRAESAPDPEPLLAYLQRYPSGHFSELAQVRLDRVLARRGELRVRPADATNNPFTGGTRSIGEFRIGDVYEYRIVDLLTGLQTGQYKQRVTAVSDDEVVYNNGVTITDALGNLRKNARGFRWDASQFFIAEYSLGKKWSTRYAVKFPDGREDVIERDFRVVARENVAVPAGSFECFRIVSSGWIMGRGIALESTYWVAPDKVNRYVAFEQRERHRSGKYIKTDRTELVSFAAAGAQG